MCLQGVKVGTIAKIIQRMQLKHPSVFQLQLSIRLVLVQAVPTAAALLEIPLGDCEMILLHEFVSFFFEGSQWNPMVLCSTMQARIVVSLLRLIQCQFKAFLHWNFKVSWKRIQEVLVELHMHIHMWLMMGDLFYLLIQIFWSPILQVVRHIGKPVIIVEWISDFFIIPFGKSCGFCNFGSLDYHHIHLMMGLSFSGMFLASLKFLPSHNNQS